MNISDTLNKAADLIEQHGWGQGGETWEDEGSGLCLEGGIAAAVGLDANLGRSEFMACPAYRAVAEHLADQMVSIPWAASGLYRWNDQECRTASEVVEVLRATAVIEAARESQLAEVSA